MSISFLQLPKAQNEILEAWDWYEDQQEGLGDRFKQELANKIKSIVSNPLNYPLKGKYRQAHINSFPFLIVFIYNKQQGMISITSVFHTSRHPKKKH